MNKKDVIAFFDKLAPSWDAEMIRSEETVARILNIAGITQGVRVLDVACGTGVLIPDYLQRGAAQVTGVDISAGMIEQAKRKFDDPRVSLLCADIETVQLEQPFDRCVLYNAFPHFPDPERLLSALAGALVQGGRLTVAHGMSREKINAHHTGSARPVSLGLMEAQELAALFDRYFAVDAVVSDERMYAVSGVKR
ncbi:MAG: class I SAM-dependent methyltransferase [Eubacteriales bacterium]|nr:class I SAM-dependent methyltransferase [Eubacteriales bacterium]